MIFFLLNAFMGNTIQPLEKYELLHVNSISPQDSLWILCAMSFSVLVMNVSWIPIPSVLGKRKNVRLCVYIKLKGACWKSTEKIKIKLFHGNFFPFSPLFFFFF